MTTTGERTCPVCRAGHAAPLFSKEGNAYWRCPDCEFRFATPDRNPNLSNTLDEYEEAYLQYLSPDPSDVVNFDTLYRWMTSVTPLDGKRLLDVGAGSGKLVRYLRQRRLGAALRRLVPADQSLRHDVRRVQARMKERLRSSRLSRCIVGACCNWPVVRRGDDGLWRSVA